MTADNASTHPPDDCTYRCPNTGHEVLAFRDERHVVIPTDEYRALLAEVERLRDGIRRLPCDHRRLDLHGGFCPRCRLLDD